MWSRHLFSAWADEELWRVRLGDAIPAGMIWRAGASVKRSSFGYEFRVRGTSFVGEGGLDRSGVAA
jgi:hypothetical protein